MRVWRAWEQGGRFGHSLSSRGIRTSLCITGATRATWGCDRGDCRQPPTTRRTGLPRYNGGGMSPVSVLVNGVAVDTVSARDRGFQYGDGLFETIAVSRGTPLLWERHAQRLLAGVVRLDMPPPETALLQPYRLTIIY